ncbi:hypothetical protein E4U09_005399 [Claviceps aff. purpurea]|uniref:Uncharacterized protein n=1 Tax=Claviceps aff. purpurea TaxID=1967640 RepID=A0A9P7QEB1_9HYPO|nr:hypothetical protein E4U09_005399 [Claviceps aff. purpurea]
MPIRPRQSRPVGDHALTTSVRDLEETYYDAGTRSAPHEAGFEAAAQREVEPQVQVQVQVQTQPFCGMFMETDTHVKDVDKGDEAPSLVTKATMEAAHKKVRGYLDHQQRYQELEVAGDEHIASIWPQEELPEEVWEEHIRPLNPTVCLRDLELKKSSSSSQGQIDRRYRLQPAGTRAPRHSAASLDGFILFIRKAKT